MCQNKIVRDTIVNSDGRSQLSNFLYRVSSPTFPEDDRPIKSIDVANLTVEEIESLNKTDPFLYYSIPAVQAATFSSKGIDYSALKERAPSKVERRSRISFECHTDLVMEEFMEDLDNVDLGDVPDMHALMESLKKNRYN